MIETQGAPPPVNDNSAEPAPDYAVGLVTGAILLLVAALTLNLVHGSRTAISICLGLSLAGFIRAIFVEGVRRRREGER